MCSLSDFRLARSLSLSVGAWLPSAAPDSARALDWAAADFCLANSVGGGGQAMGSASPPAGWQHRGEGSPPCALSQISGWRDHGLYPLARGCRAPRRILPEPWTGRLPISVWRIRLAAAAELWGQRRRRRAGNTAVRGSPPCALSQISGWRDRCLYPLARGCRAPRRILPEPWTGRLPISVWRIRLAAAAELWGQRRRRRAGNTAVRGSPPCALSQISGWRDPVFIRWRVAAERRAGFCPSLGLGGCRFLFGEFGWRRRPSYGVSVAAGGLATPR